MSPTRQQRLIDALRAASHPLSGDELGRLLGVSARSVRKYVQEINGGHDAALIVTSHRGYTLDEAVWRTVSAEAPDRRIETPMERLYYITRRLVTSSDGEDVYDLAEMLYVSDSTIEGDLSKVRGLLAEYGLELQRTRSNVRIVGSERAQRRLVRQLLLESARGVTAAGLSSALLELQTIDLRELTGWIRDILERHELVTQEYGLHDLALHVAIAVSRVTAGHTRDRVEEPVAGGAVRSAADELADRIEERHDVQLSEPERAELARLMVTRTGSSSAGAAAVGNEYLLLVQSILDRLADRYLLDIDDDTFVVNLSLHVRNLIARARSGTAARNPLGESFKQDHPLIHELAVFVAAGIEEGAQITMDEDEIVFIAFHLGAYLQRTLESTGQVRVVCVVPQYYSTADEFTRRVASRLGDVAAVVDTVTALDYDWASLDADLVVTSTPLPTGVSAPIVSVSPIPSVSDLDAVVDAVRTARSEKSGARIRWAITELIDPRLFTRVTRTTREDALALMAAQLEAEGVVGAGFLDDVEDRERLSPTAFGGSIAVPHSMNMNAQRTAISILISEEPIDWAGSRVHLAALFALDPQGRRVFRDVLDDFIATLADSARIGRIVKAAVSYDAFAAALLSEIGQ